MKDGADFAFTFMERDKIADRIKAHGVEIVEIARRYQFLDNIEGLQLDKDLAINRCVNDIQEIIAEDTVQDER